MIFKNLIKLLTVVFTVLIFIIGSSHSFAQTQEPKEPKEPKPKPSGTGLIVEPINVFSVQSETKGPKEPKEPKPRPSRTGLVIEPIIIFSVQTDEVAVKPTASVFGTVTVAPAGDPIGTPLIKPIPVVKDPSPFVFKPIP
jgi:hypothetical protein